MITDIFNTNIAKILTLISVSPGSRFNRDDIKVKTMLNNVPLDYSLNILVNNNILIKEKRLYILNFSNEFAKDMIQTFNKEYMRFKEIPLNIYYLLLDVSFALSTTKKVENIYLFGSFSKLIHTDKSDVDLAIILNELDKDIIKEMKKSILKIEKKYNKLIETHFFEKKDMKVNDPIIKEIKKNGIMLY
ncbi:MAG: nucleotidyltransferase domain-containing protein [Candidatus Woesearchaeota archaeon]